MAPSLKTLLVTVIMFAPALSDTLMIFTGHITCELDQPFSYFIEVLEIDPSDQTLLSRGEASCNQLHSSFYNLSAVDSHDGWFNNYYDIDFRIVHNCNSQDRKQKLSYQFFVNYIPITHGTEYNWLDFDITDGGADLPKVPYHGTCF